MLRPASPALLPEEHTSPDPLGLAVFYAFSFHRQTSHGPSMSKILKSPLKLRFNEVISQGLLAETSTLSSHIGWPLKFSGTIIVHESMTPFILHCCKGGARQMLLPTSISCLSWRLAILDQNCVSVCVSCRHTDHGEMHHQVSFSSRRLLSCTLSSGYVLSNEFAFHNLDWQILPLGHLF